VPGSPLVLEATVAMLRADTRVDVEIVAGMSFLELAWERLGIDPIDQRVRLIDAERFVVDTAGDHGPFLVAQVYSRAVASAVKLAVEDPPAEPVVVLSHLGCADESLTSMPWSELDRGEWFDHLSCLFIPEIGSPVANDLVRAIEVVRTLRAECPWDKAQTHESLARQFHRGDLRSHRCDQRTHHAR